MGAAFRASFFTEFTHSEGPSIILKPMGPLHEHR
jgi:hypothetical protein